MIPFAIWVHGARYADFLEFNLSLYNDHLVNNQLVLNVNVNYAVYIRLNSYYFYTKFLCVIYLFRNIEIQIF